MSRTVRVGATVLVALIIFLGLPLAGWGWTDPSGFVAHPARRAYVILVLVLNTYAAIRIPEIGKRRPAGKRIVARQHSAVQLMQVISIAVVLAAPYGDRRELAMLGGGDVVRYLGLLLYVFGFLLMHWTEATLGKQFSVEVTLQEGHTLVTSGPYRHLRHPRYLGIILFLGGISLVFRSGPGLVLVGGMVLVLLWRIHDEEALMREEFGSDWDAYAHRSWRLVPFVY